MRGLGNAEDEPRADGASADAHTGVAKPTAAIVHPHDPSHVIQSQEMPDPDLQKLEYAFPLPVLPLEDWRTSLSRTLALGYVFACILALLLMGTIMAFQV